MHTAEIEIDNEVCYISVTQFGDTNFVTISDTGTFGSFYQVEKKEKMGNESIFQIQPIFGWLWRENDGFLFLFFKPKVSPNLEFTGDYRNQIYHKMG